MSERKGTKALELWCRRLLAGYNGISIDNMSTSWRNGLAFCALIHRFRPDLIDFETLKAEDIYLNNELAFRTAETHLGIPALLDPEDMVDNEVPDRLSILTYLSQYYQRLGHTVTKSPSHDNDNGNGSIDTSISPQSPLSVASSLKLSKGGYERCTTCGMPVYLAQRLMVSHKLYHRSCFRCSSCDIQLSPHSCYENATSTQFCCEACKYTVDLPRLEQDDRMGMLMFDENITQSTKFPLQVNTKNHSISDRIKLFENKGATNKMQPNIRKSWEQIEKDVIDGKRLSSAECENVNIDIDSNSALKITNTCEKDDDNSGLIDVNKPSYNDEISIDNAYKSNESKLNFLQTQLSADIVESSVIDKCDLNTDEIQNKITDFENEEICDNASIGKDDTSACTYLESDSVKINSNIPDDVRLEEKFIRSCKLSESLDVKDTVASDNIKISGQEPDVPVEIPIIVPPRRKNANKNTSSKSNMTVDKKVDLVKKQTNEYPGDLNPFSDSEDENIRVDKNKPDRTSTNPFGSSDDEDEDPQTEIKKNTATKIDQPCMTAASNPFWSDGEEPISDEDESHQSLNLPRMYGKNSVTTSTPNLQLSKVRRTKARAPKPPVIAVQEVPSIEINDTHSLDDRASLSSMSSHCSTVNSETKQSLKLTPKLRKKRPAPTSPDNTSLISTGSGSSKQQSSLIQGKHLFADEPYTGPNSEGLWRRVKGPAPGLPLPGKRVVRPELSPLELQNHLDLLETQQLGLERQGVLIEQMIREKCEGEHATPTPTEEVEDLVIQLCELVNEKNDLFRKQAELMYIRRQQRLEQEQADIEHEIRIIQSRPAVNRIDADKCREEQLVSRLVSVVRLRDELVQQLESERRRERAEDAAIATCIAQRRAKRNNSDSNNSSLKSDDVVRTPKKSKVKDRVKKQLKKAKNTLNIKKKDSEGQSKESGNVEKKEKDKSKWF